jgi:hypothetical protein
MNTKPDPSFTSALEWQLRSEMRRGVSNPTRRVLPKGITLVAVALASGLAGAACLGAAMQVQESRRGQVIVAGLTLRETAAKQAAEFAKKLKENVEAMRAAGTVTQGEVERAKARAEAAAAAARIAALELAEAKASSQPARNEISAPKVGGRDFLAERLLIEQEQAALKAKAEAELQREAHERIAAGLAARAEAAAVELAASLSKREAERVTARAALRAKFVAGQVTAERAEQEDLLAKMQTAQDLAAEKLATAQKTLARVTALRDAGTASNADLNEAQLLVATLRVELEIARAELAALQAAK